MDFIQEVIAWYQQNKRDLPWRHTTDPYTIWLSEIILQQTRVEQGMPYFFRFIENYPTVADFASASEEEILRHWQGLGYYSRGRNMHKTANVVMEEFAGYFPGKYEELIKLKGVGEYTAAAISSFTANEPRAVVDGNVFRLLSRYFGVYEAVNTSKGKKVFTDLANEVIDKQQPGLSNQAIMEFGSLVCRPKNPDCFNCPLIRGCLAYETGTITKLPVKRGTQKIRTRYFNYLIVIKDDKILMSRRGPNDIWQNLHDFPLIETEEFTPAADIISGETFRSMFGDKCTVTKVEGPVKHILTHQRIFAQFIFIEGFEHRSALKTGRFYVAENELEKLAQPKLIFAFLKNFSKLKH
jgi:A/G-specific adenine glycosylase